MKQRDSISSESENTGLVAGQVLSTSSIDAQDIWIVDPGASCHICNNENLFVELCCLEKPQEVVLGEGYTVEATRFGDVALEVTTTGDKIKECKLYEVLYVPKCILQSDCVSKATKSGKTVEFSDTGEIMELEADCNCD